MIKKDTFILDGADQKRIFGDCTYDDKATNSGTIIFIHGFKGFKDWGAHDLTAAFFASNGTDISNLTYHIVALQKTTCKTNSYLLVDPPR